MSAPGRKSSPKPSAAASSDEPRQAVGRIGNPEPSRRVAIRLTEDMYAAVSEELRRVRAVSDDLRQSFDRALPVELTRPWPEYLYVVACSRDACAELRAHLDRALGRARGVRRGALSRALLRLGDAEAALDVAVERADHS